MAGGMPYSDDEKRFFRKRLAAGETHQAIYQAHQDTFGIERTAAAVSRQLTELKKIPDPEPSRPSPESVLRHLSGEAVPGVRDGPAFPDWEIPQDVDWREWFDSFETVLDLHKRIDPSQEILTVDLAHHDAPVCLVMASDLHLGGGFTDHREIRKTMELILETPGMYVALIGDVMEGFIPGEKSAETVEQMAAGLKAQLAAMRSLVDELCKREKILCLTWGDHDAKWFEKLVGLNIVKASFHDRVPYFQGRGLIRLKVGSEEYFVQVNHAFRGNSQYNPNHAQRKANIKFFPADVTASGHTHKPAFQMMHHYEQLREVGVNIGGKSWLVQCGTWKTGPDPYTIRAWNRGIIGCPTAVFQPDMHDVDMFEDPAKAIAFRRGFEDAAR